MRYAIIWLVLLALTATSYTMSTLHLGELDLVVSLAIAVVKSTLVALFFMHLWGARTTAVFALPIAVAMIVLLTTLTAADVATRKTFPPALLSPRASER